VAVGAVVTFRVQNAPTNTLKHNFTIGPPFNAEHDAHFAPGETITLTVVLGIQARAEYECSIPGHAVPGGMLGFLIVGNGSDGNGPAPVTYPFFGFGLTLALIVGFAGFGYIVHHAVNARGRESPKERPGPRK